MESARRDLPSGTITFLFSDIEGSTPLLEELDTSTYRELIEQHNRLLRQAFASHGGIERGTEGDSFMVVFENAPSAVRAAVAAQTAVSEATWPESADLRVRMGLHTGEGVRGADDYVGIDVNRAARVAAAAHGGQILISDSTRALSERTLAETVTMRDLGSHRLKGLQDSERLFEVVVEGLAVDYPPPRTAGIGSVHLPSRLTSFVGRTAEIEDLRDRLASSRLITLVGPGGTGKTSLAVELGRNVAQEFSDGVWFVDLAPLNDADLVESAIANALGLATKSSRSTLDLIESHLSQRELLLLLDNFEHVLPAAQTVSRLLSSSDRLHVVTTSRSRLNLYGEHTYPVPPLPVSGDDHGAVSLFAERARSVRPDFSLDDDNAEIVSEICRRLDGLPLAIELAASRVRLLDLTEILERLEQDVAVLSADSMDLPERHRTLERLIGWSFDLLGPTEREFFARASAFVGGFSIDAADAVCNPAAELGAETLGLISSLESHSLVRRAAAPGTSRFEMLETIRDYALRQAEEGGSQQETQRLHLEHYRRLAELAEPHLMSSSQTDWLERLDLEQGNLRQALRHAVDSRRVDEGLKLAASIWRYWFERGLLREGREWLEALLALEDGSDSDISYRARAYSALGGLVYWLSDAEATENAYGEALRLYQMGDDEGAIAEAWYDYAYAASMKGDLEEAKARFGASINAARESGDPALVARNQIAFGLHATVEGRPGEAVSLLESALETLREGDDVFNTSFAFGALGQAYMAAGDLDKGRSALLQALEISANTGNLPVIGAGLRTVALIRSSTGNHLEAVRLIGAAEVLEEETGAESPMPKEASVDLGAMRRELGEEAFQKAMEEGRTMTVEDTVEYASKVIDSLRGDRSAGSGLPT